MKMLPLQLLLQRQVMKMDDADDQITLDTRKMQIYGGHHWSSDDLLMIYRWMN